MSQQIRDPECEPASNGDTLHKGLGTFRKLRYILNLQPLAIVPSRNPNQLLFSWEPGLEHCCTENTAKKHAFCH